MCTGSEVLARESLEVMPLKKGSDVEATTPAPLSLAAAANCRGCCRDIENKSWISLIHRRRFNAFDGREAIEGERATSVI